MGASTIKIFLADGTPLGIRVIEKSNWTGRGVEFSRTDWPRARKRDEFGRPGVYVLTGVEDDGRVRVYVGEADVLGTRIAQHHAGPAAKEFWTRAIVFASTNDSLNKAHARYIESRLVGLASQAKRCTLENAATPNETKLSESDRADAEAFLEDMLLVYPLVGIDAFVPPPSKEAVGLPALHLSGRGITALGREAPEGFVVLEGSRAAGDEVPSIHDYLKALRKTLVDSTVLVADAGGYRVTQDYTFNSPSTAAGVLLGRSANGRAEWKDDAKRSLKEIQEKQAG
jgi:hypothetical protein